MAYRQVKIKENTDLMINNCIKSFRYHHPEFDNIHISRDKIIYEMAKFYMKVK